MPSMPQADPASLAAAFLTIPDPRRTASVRYPLPALLALTTTALLAGQRSILAVAEWIALQPGPVRSRLGLCPERAPRQSTLHRLFARLDVPAVASVLHTYFSLDQTDPSHPVGISLDGKALRGQQQFHPDAVPVDLLSAMDHATGLVIAQIPLQTHQQPHHGAPTSKAATELGAAPDLIARLDWHGRVLIGDALFCQRQLCRQVLAAGGDYLLLVKGNQPTLQRDLIWLFDPPPGSIPALPLRDRRVAQTHAYGHGRSEEVRHLVASTDLHGYLDWPGVQQVVRLERSWQAGGTRHRQVQYAISSLSVEVGTPTMLLELKRGHWGIENGRHRVKDVVLGEDASLIHVGSGALVLAMVREFVLNLLYRSGERRVASACRRMSQQPHAALDLVLGPPPTHA